MTALHPGELPIDADLVRALLREQFPEFANLPLERVPSAGTVNVLYRLGDDLVVRLPRLRKWGVDIVREDTWLPRLAPHLPLAIPEPVGLGQPTDAFPTHWSLVRWIDGEVASEAELDQGRVARQLGSFVAALRLVPIEGAPRAEPKERGGDLMLRDRQVRTMLARLAGELDLESMLVVWERALDACAVKFEPVWVHTDLLPSNLLIRDGELIAVLDVGAAAVGDPACDLTPAWAVFDETARGVFRQLLGPTEAEWARAQGWILDQALMALPYYRETNPTMVAMARNVLDALAAA